MILDDRLALTSVSLNVPPLIFGGVGRCRLANGLLEVKDWAFQIQMVWVLAYFALQIPLLVLAIDENVQRRLRQFLPTARILECRC